MKPISNNFKKEVEERSEQKIRLCYSCFKCSLGCPVIFAMDYAPHQIIKMIQCGLEEKVLNSHTIWVCASCETCGTRCPSDIDVAKVMDTLREMAVEKRVPLAEKKVAQFHKSFLDSIKKHGRLFEFEMMGDYKIKSRDISFKKDISLARETYKKGKLIFKPHNIKGIKEIKEMFKKAGF